MDEYDIIGPGDQAALLAISTPEVLAAVKTALAEMGYKVHEVENHDQFDNRYHQFNYQVVVIEEGFAGSESSENYALRMVQELPMSQRRHADLFPDRSQHGDVEHHAGLHPKRPLRHQLCRTAHALGFGAKDRGRE